MRPTRGIGVRAAFSPNRMVAPSSSPVLALLPWALPVLLLAVAIAAGLAGATGSYAAAYPVDPRTGLLFAPALGVTVWACAELIGHRASGATGSDPYAYAQMAVDLVRTGTVLHRFELLPLVLHPSLSLTWDPLVHIGYHLPVNEPGDAPTVWPVGAAFPLALGYLVGGDEGLYWVNPLATFGAAAATGLLAWMLIDSKPRPVRLAVAILAGGIILTSNEQVLWARVPMADAQAEVFTTLAIVAALWAGRQPSVLPGRSRATIAALLLCGAMLGAAYLVRHTQVLMAPALTLLLVDQARRGSFRRLGLVGLAALIVALPDFWYRQQSLGGWLRPESEELRLFSSAALLITPERIWSALTHGDEFGWLVPLIAIGAWRLARDHRRALVGLLTWLAVLVAFHLPYPALRLRDLIPEFPVLAVLAALGVTWVIESVHRAGKRPLSLTLPREGGGNIADPASRGVKSALSSTMWAMLLFLSIDAFALRFWSEAHRPFDPPEHVFGYLTAEHRAAFDTIASVVPRGGIIAADFNDGALDLLSGRDTVRAGLWTPWERHLFFCRAESGGRPIYVLDDSQAIEGMLGG
ncbi:MAG TPA: hypothetical protein VGK54_13285, partial [Chloroflexota bacterium]